MIFLNSRNTFRQVSSYVFRINMNDGVGFIYILRNAPNWTKFAEPIFFPDPT